METNHIKLKTLGLSSAVILVVEWFAFWLNNHTAMPLPIIGAARCLEILALLGICYVTEPMGIKTLGIIPNKLLTGLLKGFLWSSGFGLLVIMVAIGLMLSGFNPLAMIASSLPQQQPDLLYFFVVGGIISPLAEEFFFRGLIYGYCRRWGVWVALLLSTAVFVLAHAIFQEIPLPQIIGGILFAIAYEKERNLVVPITIHILGNLAIFTLSLLQ